MESTTNKTKTLFMVYADIPEKLASAPYDVIYGTEKVWHHTKEEAQSVADRLNFSPFTLFDEAENAWHEAMEDERPIYRVRFVTEPDFDRATWNSVYATTWDEALAYADKTR